MTDIHQKTVECCIEHYINPRAKLYAHLGVTRSSHIIRFENQAGTKAAYVWKSSLDDAQRVARGRVERHAAVRAFVYDVLKKEIIQGYERFGKVILLLDIQPVDKARLRQQVATLIAQMRNAHICDHLNNKSDHSNRGHLTSFSPPSR